MDIASLAAFGAHVDEGLARCMGNEDLYLRLVGTMQGNAGFDDLKAAIDEHRLDDAFEAAHALKGALGNLSLTPLYDPICAITEHLRAREDMDYSELLDTIMAKKEEFFSL